MARTAAQLKVAVWFQKTKGKKQSMRKTVKKKIKKVIKGLKKASKLHAGQAKSLKSVVKK